MFSSYFSARILEYRIPKITYRKIMSVYWKWFNLWFASDSNEKRKRKNHPSFVPFCRPQSLRTSQPKCAILIPFKISQLNFVFPANRKNKQNIWIGNYAQVAKPKWNWMDEERKKKKRNKPKSFVCIKDKEIAILLLLFSNEFFFPLKCAAQQQQQKM